MELLNDSQGLLTTLAMLVSIFALTVSFRAFNLKCGNKVTGFYNVVNDTNSTIPYVKEIILQNLKDKEVAVHNIYIRFGRNIYVDMLNKNEQDYYILVIPPFGTLNLKFGPPCRFTYSRQTVDMKDLLMNHKPGKIVLSTNEGRIVVKRIKKGLSSRVEKKLGAQYITQQKYYSKDSVYSNGNIAGKAIDFSSYGDRAKYIVTFNENGKETEYGIFDAQSTQMPKFRRVKFTDESLRSIESLKQFLVSERDSGNVLFDSIVEIIDFSSILQQFKEDSARFGYFVPQEKALFTYAVFDKLGRLVHRSHKE